MPQLDEIFFESSSKKSFKDEVDKKDFYWKYLGFYLDQYSEFIWLTFSDKKLLGYCLGMPQTMDENLFKLQPHLKLFQSHFESFPGHLHINLHADARGQGLGQKLLGEFENQLHSKGIKGVHLITGVNSRNSSFYLRLGYGELARDSAQGMLLLGKRLRL